MAAGTRKSNTIKSLLKTSSNCTFLAKSITDSTELKEEVGRGTNKYNEGVKTSGDLKGAESLGLFLKVKCGFMK